MKKHIALLSLVAIVFLSGCVRQGTETTTGQGVVVKSFSVEPAEIEPGISATIAAVVKNVGEMTAKDIEGELMPSLSDDVFTIEPSRKLTIDKMYYADPELGLTEGEEKPLVWTVTPKVSKDVLKPYEVHMRLSYQYKTAADVTFRVISLDYYKTLPTSEQKAEDWGIIDSKTTSGPIVVTIGGPKLRIPSTATSAPVWVEVRNIGGGNVYKSSARASNELNVLEVKVEGITCLSSTVALIDGRGTLVCEKQFVAGDVKDYKDFNIKAETTYYYSTNTYSTLTVLRAWPGAA